MLRRLLHLVIFAGCLFLSLGASLSSVRADDGEKPSAIAVPKELQRFSGMMIGRLVDRDIEKGSFTVTVDYVARVWRNNKSSDPRSAVGKTLRVNGVSGKWIDQLLLIRPGETIEFEAQHREGDAMRFPGEWLKKTKPFDAKEHPVPPNGFRGFAGLVRGKVIAKRTESRELVLRIDAVEKEFNQNKAKDAKSIVGKPIVLAGFWAAMSKPFEPLRPGDTIRAGVLHRVPQSDHFSVVETAKKVSATDSVKDPRKTSEQAGGFPEGMRGFRGILRGKLVSRDVEKGELTFVAEKVTRVWKRNEAKDTSSCRGKEFLVKGVAGKWLDVLLTLKKGDRIEVEAFHNGEGHLDFVKEWLKKVD